MDSIQLEKIQDFLSVAAIAKVSITLIPCNCGCGGRKMQIKFSESFSLEFRTFVENFVENNSEDLFSYLAKRFEVANVNKI